MEKYIIINRLVMQECGIDLSNVTGVTSSESEAYEIFEKNKKNLLQSMADYGKSVIRDVDDVFCIQYIAEGLLPAYCYTKIINLY